MESTTVENWLKSKNYSNSLDGSKYENIKHNKILREFQFGYVKKDWISWQNFGKQQHVYNWCLVEGNYAIAFNTPYFQKNSYPLVKLDKEIFEKYLNA